MTTLQTRPLPTGQPRSLIFPISLTGAVLGVLAGLAQAIVGASIPAWSGAKAAPLALGLLTIVLSLLAALAATRLRRPDLSTGSRAGLAAMLLVPGLLCFTTVGRLWYFPGALLVISGLVSIERWRDTAALVKASWLRCLLGLLGISELLMAAGAPPLLMGVGAVGGLCLLAAAWLFPPRTTFIALVIVGTVPFAVLAWTGVVPVLLVLATAAVAVPLTRSPSPRTRRRSPRPSTGGGRPQKGSSQDDGRHQPDPRLSRRSQRRRPPVSLIGYHLSGWDAAGDQIDVDGESVRLQGFTSGAPRTVLVIGTSGSRLTLLVVPPHTPEAAARQALREAAQPVDAGAAAIADEERGAADERHQGLAARLVAVRGSVDRPTIERWVQQAARRFHEAPVQAYVPVLIEHIVRQQIRASTA